MVALVTRVTYEHLARRCGSGTVSRGGRRGNRRRCSASYAHFTVGTAIAEIHNNRK